MPSESLKKNREENPMYLFRTCGRHAFDGSRSSPLPGAGFRVLLLTAQRPQALKKDLAATDASLRKTTRPTALIRQSLSET